MNNQASPNTDRVQGIKPGMGLLQEVAIGDELATHQLQECTLPTKKGNG